MIANVAIGLAVAGAGLLKLNDSFHSREHNARLSYHLFRKEMEMDQLMRSYGAYSGNEMFTKSAMWLTDSRWFMGLRSFLKYKTRLFQDVVADNWIPIALAAIGLTVAFPGMWGFMGGALARTLAGSGRVLGPLLGKAVSTLPNLNPLPAIAGFLSKLSPLGAAGVVAAGGMATYYGTKLSGEITGDNQYQYLGGLQSTMGQIDNDMVRDAHLF